ncbi:hypothetical protein BDZ90DRAFT_262087 [Jaminaea rosea]|uniref:RNase H type-1 domain-containing protein n=1 Tax=Jaminaea rosea TaxID=1569628 RepID=A0A316UKX7_9BASI|nr:hypothetical protein BDZ90DRAFT_262087 [Jaminaea rosea]PWN25889.1 hypothetical protein BDZ90DRAFT_262087 [Jaminaea rosea]
MGKRHVVHTGGACKNSGGSSPKGAIGVHSARSNISERLPASMGRHTSSMAEHAAINRGLKSAPHDGKPVAIKTDAQSCQKTLSGGGRAQQSASSGGGNKSGGGKSAEQALVRDTMREAGQGRSEGQNVHFEHVKSGGSAGNVLAHELAQQALQPGQARSKPTNGH